MIVGTGIDVENIKRFERACKNKNFLMRIYTNNELEYCRKKKEPQISFAGKFCAKEATIKASNRQLSMKDIEITNLKSGKISVKIKGKRVDNLRCSIAHTSEYAVSFVIIEKIR
jgi:holo-[acyl-carrier protein] synthase